MGKGRLIGIDFGTTKTVCAAWSDGKVRFLPGQYGQPFTPSCVLFRRSGTALVGWDAKKHPDRFREDYVSVNSVKRKMGREGESSWNWWKGRPQQVAGYILAAAKRSAEKALGEPVEGAVVAVPAHFHAVQRRATGEAGKIAGLQELRLLNEATAAAIAWNHREGGAERTVAVFDFGGGTLDVSILACGDGVYEVIATAGDGDLGGDDLDRLVLRHLVDSMAALFGSQKFVLGTGSRVEGLEIAEAIKRELSGRERVEKSIPGFVNLGHGYSDLHYSLERSEFEGLMAGFVQKAKAVWRSAVKDLRGPIHAVILIGGTSRIPLVQKAIGKEAGRKPILGEGELVAYGAALYASVLQGSPPQLVLLDATPATLSVATRGGAAVPLVEKGTTVPVERTKSFTTTEDNQASLDVVICVGEKATVDANLRLGMLRLEVPPGPKGSQQIEVTFKVDADQTLNVAARDKATGKRTEATLDSPYALNEAQLGRLRREVGNWEVSQDLPERVARLTQVIDNLLQGSTDATSTLIAGQLRRARHELEGTPSHQVVLRVEERVANMERTIEMVASLETGIGDLCGAWRAEWGCTPTMLSQAPDLVRGQLRNGTLSAELMSTVRGDLAVHSSAFEGARALRSRASRLLGLAPLAGLEAPFAEARQWLDMVKSRSPASAEELEMVSRKGKRAFARSLVRVFVRGDRALRDRLAGEFSHEIRDEPQRLAHAALALLDRRGPEVQWRALGALDTLVSQVNLSLTSERARAVLDHIVRQNAWEMRDALRACVKQLEPKSLADSCRNTPQIRALLLEGPVWKELRERVVDQLKANLASPDAAGEHVQALAELSAEEDALIALLDSAMAPGARAALYDLVRESSRRTAIRPLLLQLRHEVEPLLHSLVECLREHTPQMTERERRLLTLTERRFGGARLSARERLDLQWMRLRDRQYGDVARFLLQRRTGAR